MTVSEKTPLLPKDYQKSHVIPIPQEDLNNNTTNESSLCEYDSYALTKAELASYIDDPFWVRVRYICFSAYWLVCIVALIVSCCIAVSALESGFCVPDAAGPINNGDGNASISSTTSAANLVTTTLVAASDGSSSSSGGVIFRLFDQPSSS